MFPIRTQLAVAGAVAAPTVESVALGSPAPVSGAQIFSRIVIANEDDDSVSGNSEEGLIDYDLVQDSRAERDSDDEIDVDDAVYVPPLDTPWTPIITTAPPVAITRNMTPNAALRALAPIFIDAECGPQHCDPLLDQISCFSQFCAGHPTCCYTTNNFIINFLFFCMHSVLLFLTV